MSPIVTMVAPLKPNRIFPVELSLSKEMFICLNVGSCNRSTALLGSTNTLCTSKSLIHKVSTSASWCGTMTLDGLMRGKGYGVIDRLNRFAADWSVDRDYMGLDDGCVQHALLLALRPILIVNWAA